MFSEKLNKKQVGTYSIEEVIEVKNGVYEGKLKHDNIITSTLAVNTESQVSGSSVENYLLSTPSEKPWETHIKIFTEEKTVYISYETKGDTVDADDINELQNKLKEHNLSLIEVDGNIRIIELEVEKKADTTYVDKKFNGVYQKSKVYTKEEVNQRIADIIGNAPENLDTLEKLAKSLDNDNSFASSITKELSNKVDKISGKGLSTNDFTNANKTKLDGIESGANKITRVGQLDNDSKFINIEEAKTILPTKLSNLIDDTSAIPIKFAERVQIKDTRNINDTPLDIMKSGKSSLRFDFKYRKVVGNPNLDISANNSYAHILTVYGWTDNTGGYPTQISFGKEKVGIRTGISNTTWSPWRTYSDDSVVNKLLDDMNIKINQKIDESKISTVGKTGNYNDLTNKPSVFNPSSHSHSEYIEKTGGEMTGTLSIKTPNFPVAKFERTTTATGNRYGAVSLVRTGAIPVDGVGIGFYFKNNNSIGNETHSGFFGGALDRVTSGGEVGQIVIAPAWRGQDPYARTDFTLTAINTVESIANFKGELRVNNNEVALKKDVPNEVNLAPVYDEIKKKAEKDHIHNEYVKNTGGITWATLAGRG